jgi:hypothetical protein
MSVRVYPDNGPSYTVHEPEPSTGRAVCANCKHVRKGFLSEPRFCKAWTCGAVPGKLIRPAGIDSITGEAVSELVSRPFCVDRNAHGECQDFAAGVAEGSTSNRTTEAPRNDDSQVDFSSAVLAAIVFFVAGACLGGIVATMWGAL